MAEGRDGVGQRDLGFVDLGPLKGAQSGTVVQRHFRIEFQEPTHVGVRRVAPELPEFVRSAHVGIQPEPDGIVTLPNEQAT